MNRIACGLIAGALVLGLSATATRAASTRPEDDAFQQRLFGRVLAKTQNGEAKFAGNDRIYVLAR